MYGKFYHYINLPMNSKFLIVAIIISLFTLVSCTDEQASNEKHNETNQTLTPKNFDWLEGNWIRTNDEEESQTYESWMKVDDIQYLGYGTTIENGDTVFSESILLHQLNEKWLFEVTGIGEEKPTIFQITEIGQLGFTCVNLENEFPTHIKYTGNEDSLTAVVSNTKMELEFTFNRK